MRIAVSFGVVVVASSMAFCCAPSAAGQESDRLRVLVRSLTAQEQHQPPLRGLVRTIVAEHGLDIEATGKPKLCARFFSQDQKLRLDVLPAGYDGALSSVTGDQIVSAVIQRPNELYEATRRNPQLIAVKTFEIGSAAADAVTASVDTNLRFPLNMHIAVGPNTITELLQLPGSSVEFDYGADKVTRISCVKQDRTGTSHAVTIELDPSRGNCVRFVSDHFSRGKTDAVVTINVNLTQVRDGAFVVSEIRQVEDLRVSGVARPPRVTLTRFSDLELAEIDESVFCLDSLKELAQETLVINVAQSGEETIAQQTVSHAERFGASGPASTGRSTRSVLLLGSATITAVLALAIYLSRAWRAHRGAQ